MTDWPRLRRRHPHLIGAAGAGDLASWAGAQIYLATPITAYLRDGMADVAIDHAARWAAELLALGLSPVSAALLTLAPMIARGDDDIGRALSRMGHSWWMDRCRPWMTGSAAMVAPPVPGWDRSRGIFEEAEIFAARLARPVLLLRVAP